MIKTLVENLPEIYQPIFGIDEGTLKSTRPCFDRLDVIQQVYDGVSHHLGRPVRVLDLGSAQGFFSFHLASRGAIVHGVDFCEENIDLCNAIASENPNLNVEFYKQRIDDYLDSIEPNKYDLVLGLSVFHHLIYDLGQDCVKSMFSKLAELSKAIILELASSLESAYWSESLPEDTRDLLKNIGFVKLLGHHPSHIGSIQRPLYFASNKILLFDNVVDSFDKWSTESHNIVPNGHDGSRHYFFGKEFVARTYDINCSRGQINLHEYRREIEFLQNVSSTAFSYPKLINFGENSEQVWWVREKLPGTLLSDCIEEGISFDSYKVVFSILTQLKDLETQGWYHADVRTWNVIVDPTISSACLIDYGAIIKEPIDCSWPKNIYLSFIIFVWEVSSRAKKISLSQNGRASVLEPVCLEAIFERWTRALWSKTPRELSYKGMLELLVEVSKSKPNNLESNCDAISFLYENELRVAFQESMDTVKASNSHLAQQNALLEATVEKVKSDAKSEIEKALRGHNHSVSEIVLIRFLNAARRLIYRFQFLTTIVRSFINLLPMRLQNFLRDYSSSSRPYANLQTEVGRFEALIKTERPRKIYFDVSGVARTDLGTGIQRVCWGLFAGLRAGLPTGYVLEPVAADPNRLGYLEVFGFGDNATSKVSISLGNKIDPEPGDIFLGVDFQTHWVEIQKAYLDFLFENDVDIYFVVYDLLPIQCPQWFPNGVNANHEKWLKNIVSYSGALCISNSVATDLNSWIDKNIPNKLENFHIVPFPMGADFDATRRSVGLPKDIDSIRNRFNNTPTFLMVGTIEPRKGHDQALESFERLWERGIDVNLCIVGKRGWQVSDLIKKILGSPYYADRIFWFEDASDQFLEELYLTAVCLLAASRGEGFGLPLIEAARNNLPVVARDIPIFREVTGEGAYFFDEDDSLALDEKIIDCLDLYRDGKLTHLSECSGMTWNKSAKSVLKLILKNVN